MPASEESCLQTSIKGSKIGKPQRPDGREEFRRSPCKESGYTHAGSCTIQATPCMWCFRAMRVSGGGGEKAGFPGADSPGVKRAFRVRTAFLGRGREWSLWRTEADSRERILMTMMRGDSGRKLWSRRRKNGAARCLDPFPGIGFIGFVVSFDGDVLQ